jgi:hypothetical protein
MEWRLTWGNFIKFSLTYTCILIRFNRFWQFKTPFLFVSLMIMIFCLIVCHATYVGSCLGTFRHSISVPSSGSSCALSWNFVKYQHTYAAKQPRILKKSSALRQKPEISLLNYSFRGVIIIIKGNQFLIQSRINAKKVSATSFSSRVYDIAVITYI